jgi:quercetin dioxygenase-like cupin family protein
VGCTGAHLSLIENGHTSPSIATLKKIAHSLGVNIVDFFVEGDALEPVVTSVGDRKNVSLGNWNAEIYQLVRSTAGKLMQPFFTVVSPQGGSHDPYSHVGEEFGIVLKGTLTLTVGDHRYEVRPGESFYYSSRVPHRWVNEGSEDVEVVWVVSPPSW